MPRKYNAKLISGLIPTILVKDEYLRCLPIMAKDDEGNQYVGGDALIRMLRNHKLMTNISEEQMRKREELRHRESLLEESDDEDPRYKG